MPLSVGARAPEVTLPSHDLEQISLSQLRGDGRVLLLFFPLAFTSTCTEELCTMGDDLASYRELDAQVAAVSVDSPWALSRFRTECGAEFPFLSDFNREATEAFGVMREGPLGPGLQGLSDRAAFVIDREGTITYAWHSPNPGILPPFDEIKQALREG
jgi:glutaredoxin-dependent peroxiredoxin